MLVGAILCKCAVVNKKSRDYFATKLVVLTQRQCRKELGRDQVPDRKTIERLVAKFRETASVANANKGR